MSDENTQAAIDAGERMALAKDRIAEVAGIPVSITYEDTKVEVIKEALDLADARAEKPRRRKGTATHQEVDSFIDHVNRFKDEGSAIFADVASTKLTAVLDYHSPGAKSDPRWGEHRSVYTAPQSREWLLWLSMNEKAMGQDVFASFIEDNMADLASPSGALDETIAQPAKVLDMARNLSVQTKGEYSRQVNVTTGESTLVCKNENEPTATKIPRAFLLQLRVFEGGELYGVTARVRFAMKDGRPTFAYSLYQHETTLREAFDEVRKKVEKGTGLVVFAGSPEK